MTFRNKWKKTVGNWQIQVHLENGRGCFTAVVIVASQKQRPRRLDPIRAVSNRGCNGIYTLKMAQLDLTTDRGATTFSKLEVQFLGLGYCTEQNMMVYLVSCTAVCYVTVITLFVKKAGVVHQNFGGPETPPVVAPLITDT